MSRPSKHQQAIEEMDQRVILLASQLIQLPAGHFRNGAILQLATAIQVAIDAWFAEMER